MSQTYLCSIASPIIIIIKLRDMSQKILAVTLTIASFFGCQQPLQSNSNTQDNLKETKDLVETQMINSNERKTDISLRIVPNKFRAGDDNKKALFILTNSSDKMIGFESYYRIDKYSDGEWTEVPFNPMIVFQDLAHGVEAEFSREYPIWLSIDLGERQHEKGRYRVTKVVWPIDHKEEKMSLTAEFSIE